MSVLDIFKSKEPINMFVVKTAVDGLKNELFKRNQKIKEKVNVLQKECDVVKSSIDATMRDLVNSDMADDEHGQISANKKIAQLRPLYDDLQARITAYQGTVDDASTIKDGISKILELARKQKDIIHETRVKEINSKARLEQEIKSMKNEVELIDQEIKRLNISFLEDQLKPLVKYIEPRVQPGSEGRFIHMYLNGQSDESQLQHCFNVTHGAPVEKEVVTIT